MNDKSNFEIIDAGMRVLRYILAWRRYIWAGLVYGRGCQLFPGSPALGLWQREVDELRPRWRKP
jgi:hypothetical protein